MLEIAIFLIGISLGALVSRFLYYLYESHTDKLEGITTPKGYHFHHSMYGIMAFFVSPIMLNNSLVYAAILLVGFGLGLIIDHTIEEGFVFISKIGDEEAGEYTEDKDLY